MPRHLLWLAVAAIGCGDGKPGPEPIEPDEIRELCTRSCSFDVDCEEADLDVCRDGCVADLGSWTRHDAVATLADCRNALACDADTEACYERVQPLAYHRAFEERCRVALAECPTVDIDTDCSVEYSPDGDDIGFYRYMTEAVMSELGACLDGADCETRLNCMDNVYLVHHIPI